MPFNPLRADGKSSGAAAGHVPTGGCEGEMVPPRCLTKRCLVDMARQRAPGVSSCVDHQNVFGIKRQYDDMNHAEQQALEAYETGRSKKARDALSVKRLKTFRSVPPPTWFQRGWVNYRIGWT